jgi:tubulin-folding cofactor B
MEALRAYVLHGPSGQPNERHLAAPQGQVRLIVKHSILPTVTERNFSLDLTVGELKQKVQLIVGTSPQYQELELQDSHGIPLAMLDEDSFLLRNADPMDGNILFVVDTDPSGTIRQLTDTSLVKKYEMSDEDYSKRDNSYRKWKESNKPAESPEKPVVVMRVCVCVCVDCVESGRSRDEIR